LFGIGGKYCPACRARMNVRETTHRAVDAQGQPVVYHGVRYYTCPNGCHTAMYDFRDAYIDDPVTGPRGWQPYGSDPRADAGPFGFLMRIDMSMWIVVVGLLLAYVMFAAGIIASHNSPVGKIVSALLLTVSALLILTFITQRQRGDDTAKSGQWGPTQGAH